MELKSVQTRRAALAKLEEAAAAFGQSRETLFGVLDSLHDESRADTFAELVADAKQWLSRLEAESPSERPQVAEAIAAYLRDHPGATSGEIYPGVRGRFQTDSADPNSLIRVTLSQMKGQDKVTMDESRRYRLANV